MNLKIVKPIKLQIIDRYFQSFTVTEISCLESCVVVKIVWYSLPTIRRFVSLRSKNSENNYKFEIELN